MRDGRSSDGRRRHVCRPLLGRSGGPYLRLRGMDGSPCPSRACHGLRDRGDRDELRTLELRRRGDGLGDLVGGADRCDSGGDQRGDLDGDAAPDRRASAPRRERRRQRQRAEAAQRRAPCALSTRERGALRALAEMGPELRPLVLREAPVELEREHALGFATRERPFELLAERAPRAEEQGLDGGGRHLEHLGDLRVGAPLELAHDERCTLVERERADRADELLHVDVAAADRSRLDQLLLERDLSRTAPRITDPRSARVVRDRDQPLSRVPRALASLVRAVRLQERRLGDVLGIVAVAQDHQRVPVHVLDVRAVQPLEGLFA